MPVQVFPSGNAAAAIKSDYVDCPEDVLLSAWPQSRFHELLQSTFSNDNLPQHMINSSNGLVHSIIQAYGQHHHLRLRPEDIWFAVLTQLNLYINANAEQLRDKFVTHQGQKKLRIDYNPFSRHNFDFGNFSRDMGHLLQKEILDPDFRAWMMPNFTTTTPQDGVVASIIMMCSLQQYFRYGIGIICGFPSVTLLGEKEDYVELRRRLDKLEEFGDEPTQFAALLRPVLSRFIRTFEDPEATDVINFWQRAMYYDDSECGVELYTGWITAFCFWNEQGKCLYKFGHDWDGDLEYAEDGKFGHWIDKENGICLRRSKHLRLMLDGVKYHPLDSKDIPPGFGRVPVIVDGGEITETEMVAGSLGITCTRSAEGMEGAELDTMQPETGWWIYAKSKNEHPDIAGIRERGQRKGASKASIDEWVEQARNTGVVVSDGEIDYWVDIKKRWA